MAIGTGAALLGSAALGIGSSYLGKRSAEKAAAGTADASLAAAQIQAESADKALDFQLASLDTMLANIRPQQQIGVDALNLISDLYGFSRVEMPRGTVVDRFDEIRGAADSTGGDAGTDLRSALEAEIRRFESLSSGSKDRGKLAQRQSSLKRIEALQAQLRSLGVSSGDTSRTTVQENPVTIDGGTGQVLPPAEERRENAMARMLNDPGIEFRLNSARAQQERSAAAQGRLYSPETMVNIGELAQNQASQEYGNAFNRLMSLAGFGSAGASQSNQAIGNTSNMAAQLITGSGNARASGLTGAANANAAGQLGSANAIAGGLNNFSNMLMLSQLMN